MELRELVGRVVPVIDKNMARARRHVKAAGSWRRRGRKIYDFLYARPQSLIGVPQGINQTPGKIAVPKDQSCVSSSTFLTTLQRRLSSRLNSRPVRRDLFDSLGLCEWCEVLWRAGVWSLGLLVLGSRRVLAL